MKMNVTQDALDLIREYQKEMRLAWSSPVIRKTQMGFRVWDDHWAIVKDHMQYQDGSAFGDILGNRKQALA